ncbi:MarR family winged helix-turn-helix transcriptional regulator [Cellulomonas marina]|uniref:DNA-binding transcriptional regulator, MarR family n=1 Tax=Cellulomonas marina TaxID=988821 RepID=A0A1I0XA31_9CELL|nr:MarR family transcriptional regulator [Cellulomonas marina]GIG29526.1 putative transcriptional regulator, MarR family protein [Cellulomonas marina]SFA97527.1 DNA-binding transcriptional regulator, MarR family [Cellulomonas marina]
MSQPRVQLDTSIGYALKQAAAALRAAMDAALRPLDLSVSQYSCLELLGQRPGLSASDLARGTFLTRQSMQTLLAGLVERGLLERAATAAEGRALPIRLTEEGARLLAEASAAVAAVEGAMVADLTPTGRRRLHDDLVGLATALAGRPS